MPLNALPSLAALRAFEAAARNRSYSAAARELNVTHAAIAQHVRTLEDHFGAELMRREGQGMAVTDVARDFADNLSDGFARIAGAARDLAERDAVRPLRVALTPSFAGNWLMPRIGRFWEAHPEIAVEFSPGAELVDLRRDGFDLAIRYGHGTWTGVETERLVSAGHAVVAAPELAHRLKIRALEDIRDAHLLMEAGRDEEKIWARANGLDLDALRVTELDNLMMVYQAILAGQGISILPWALVERDVAAGRLVVLCEAAKTELAYYILTRPGRVSPRVRQFVRWLKRQVA
ncbi:LysR family transcriptional regulator [Sulfitobacter sp. D35]|uniref:LysR family transcriptional regulator n=1 Tax=Sulfitobacter sp. D35 TaxID=3083252 RepID=UPI00296EF554|nr:LysR family transcriptional regulator [Sulfitobacter sp. D35]MDW4498098.1 LysR family transcriptional regulator [Sulfitobacter sp. D35]